MLIPPEILKQCWFLTGPTACGKTKLALQLAREIDAEILALDSMSLYRGMDIGTAKPTVEEQTIVPHHLIDILDPWEEFSLADYVQKASLTCEEILSRNRIPLFVGGTGLYLRGLLRGVFEGPPCNQSLRDRLEREATHLGKHVLHQRLQKIDPVSAKRIHPNDLRRVVRALEVYELTGQPLSDQQQQSPKPTEEQPEHVYWLSPPVEWLYERINQRAEQMMQQGLIHETRKLLHLEFPVSRTASQALGYQEVFEYLAGNQTYEETVELIQQHTRQFSKRQRTWFRNLEECQQLPFSAEDFPDELCKVILNKL